MANVDRPNGFRPVGTLNGSPWQGAVRQYTLDTGHLALGVGDLVTLIADGAVQKYAAGDTQLLGVVVAVHPQTKAAVGGMSGDSFMSTGSVSLDLPGKNTIAADTAGVISVCVAPDVILEAQEDGDTDPLELIDVGANIEIIDAGVNATTGLSGMELDSSTHNTTNTLPLKILGMAQTPGNELGDTANAASRPVNCRWLVTPANHTFKGLNVAL